MIKQLLICIMTLLFCTYISDMCASNNDVFLFDSVTHSSYWCLSDTSSSNLEPLSGYYFDDKNNWCFWKMDEAGQLRTHCWNNTEERGKYIIDNDTIIFYIDNYESSVISRKLIIVSQSYDSIIYRIMDVEVAKNTLPTSWTTKLVRFFPKNGTIISTDEWLDSESWNVNHVTEISFMKTVYVYSVNDSNIITNIDKRITEKERDFDENAVYVLYISRGYSLDREKIQHTMSLQKESFFSSKPNAVWGIIHGVHDILLVGDIYEELFSKSNQSHVIHFCTQETTYNNGNKVYDYCQKWLNSQSICLDKWVITY